MAKGNFYQDGNHGLNVIVPFKEDEIDTTVEDTLVNLRKGSIICTIQ